MARCFRTIVAIASVVLMLVSGALAQTAATNRLIFEEMLKLASKGQAEAQYHVGMMLNNGIGTAADQKEAFEWFRKSAAAGDPLGAYKLGCYYHGQFPGVVERDEALGLKYKLVAADQGYDLAQSDVAMRYYASNDFTEAVRWWTQAARQGHPESMYHLSRAYAEGKGAPVDLKMSHRYLYALSRMPEFSSDQFITDALAALTREMSPDEVTSAQNAEAFVPDATALSLKAHDGITQAKLYLAANMQ